MRTLWTIARREVRGYFDHATAYILVIAFLAISLFLAFRNLYGSGLADLRSFFSLLPWYFAVFVPAVTMRSLAEERGRGTLEWLMAHPMTEVQLVGGKFLGNWLFALITLAGTLPTAAGVLLVSEADPGIMVAQYVGAALLAAQMVALGLFTSSLSRNQITAFIFGVGLSLVLILAGLGITLVGLPPSVGRIVAQLAIIPHFENVARGAVDLRDVLYFLSTAFLFLALAYFMILRERLSGTGPAYRRLQLGTVALAAAVVVLNLLGGRIHGRLDLTRADLYTLSRGTRDLLADLDDVVTVKLFVSRELPPEITMTLRDVRDLLADYRRLSDGRIRVQELHPDEDEDAADEASSLGIQAIQFNVLREDEFQVRRGWLGLAVLYADQRHVIPFIPRTDDLEYRLTSAIARMTADEKPRVAFLTGFGARSSYQIQGLSEALGDRYEIRGVNLEQDTVPELSPDSFAVVVVAGPDRPLSPGAVEAVESYLDAGGAALLLLDPNRLDPQAPFLRTVPTGLEDLVEARGVTLAEGVVYDLRSNQPISVGQRSIFSLIRAYPFWPIALPAANHPTTRELESLLLGWASPLEIVDTARVVPLWTTTPYGGRRPGGTPVTPDVEFPTAPEDLSTEILAVAVQPPVTPEEGGGEVAEEGEPEAAPTEVAAAPGAGNGAAGANEAQEREEAGADTAASRTDTAAGAADTAVAGESGASRPVHTTAPGRLVVVGDVNFLDDQFVRGNPQNLVFFANALDWLAQDEALIEIRSKDRTPPPLLFTSDLQKMALRWGNLLGVPLLFVLVGSTWWGCGWAARGPLGCSPGSCWSSRPCPPRCSRPWCRSPTPSRPPGRWPRSWARAWGWPPVSSWTATPCGWWNGPPGWACRTDRSCSWSSTARAGPAWRPTPGSWRRSAGPRGPSRSRPAWAPTSAPGSGRPGTGPTGRSARPTWARGS